MVAGLRARRAIGFTRLRGHPSRRGGSMRASERLAARLGRRCFFQLRQHAEKGLHVYNGNSQLPRPPGLATETVGVGGDHKFGEAADAAGNPESSPLT